MEELKIFDLYEKFNTKTAEEFINKIDSTVDVKAEYEKVIEDTEWIEIIEETIPYIDNILRNPNRFIINEEEIVKIELARKITVESIKHLSKNTNLIQDYNKKTGDVRPSKILNINKEENYDTYENRFIYTLIQNMKFFISRKKKAVEERQKISEKNNKQLNYIGNSNFSKENVEISIKLNTSLNSNSNSKQNNKENILDRIEKLERKITDLTCSEVYKIIEKKHITLITSPIKKTNVILKNVNFQYAVKLWNFLQTNLDDKSKHINENEEHSNEEELKKLADETFLLNYIILNSIDKDTLENEENQKEIKSQSMAQMIERIVDLNSELSQKELKELIADKYLVVKYRNIATIGEIQKIFKQHIDEYIKNVGEKTNVKKN